MKSEMPADVDSSVMSVGEKSQMGVVKRTDEDISDENLTEIEEQVATANDFIVYGKASVEIFDEDTVSQKIQMDAFEESLDQFFAQGGNISYQHKDVIVGEALREYELSSDVSIEVGDETHEYESGDTLKTRVEDDALWLVANIYSREEPAGSDASVMTRLGAYEGKLDGFSVTIKNKAYRNTADGQVITEIDFHSVTVGTGDQIKNPESLFGVAEFKLRDRIDNVLNLNTRTMNYNILDKLRTKSTEALGEETVKHALSESGDLRQSAEHVASEGSADDVQAKAESRLSEVQEKADDREDLVAMLADMTELSEDEVTEALDSLLETDEKEASGASGADEAGSATENEEEEEMTEDKEDTDDEEEETTDDKADVSEEAQAISDEMGVPVSEVMEALSVLEGEPDEVPEDEDEATEGGDADSKADETTSDESEDGDVDAEQKASSPSENGLTEEEVEEMIDEKMDTMLDQVGEKVDEMQEDVAEAVSEQVSEKLQSGSTPESDATPADDGERNLLDDW